MNSWHAEIQAAWRCTLLAGDWESRRVQDSLPCLYIVISIVERGPDTNESPHDFNDRIASAYRHYLEQQDVVGRLQKECQPRNDAGDDEDGYPSMSPSGPAA